LKWWKLAKENQIAAICGYDAGERMAPADRLVFPNSENPKNMRSIR
jgi:hypothetical protein